MAMETYRFEVGEMDSAKGISADVYDEDGTIEATETVAYEEFGIEAVREDGHPDARTEEFTVDAMRVDVEVVREEGTDEAMGYFEFAVLADGDRAARVRVADTDWRLASVGDE